MRKAAYQWCLPVAASLACATFALADPPDLTQFSLEELGNLEVTSASKKPEKLQQTAHAITVITQDDIERAGVTSIPEALRLAPGVQVAQIDANKWAIGIRGFASRLSRSLLVLIDGRSVYSPLFAGVYWEAQDIVLQDIDRIEVIRGPGGSLWGANAVNGVINIITKRASETHGALIDVAPGTEQQRLTAQYGSTLGAHASWRAYGTASAGDAGFHPDSPEFDQWHRTQAGFRVDRFLSNGDEVTVQGDGYTGRFGEMVTVGSYDSPFSADLVGDARLGGANLLGRWTLRRGRSVSSLQAYYDRTTRDSVHFTEKRNTFDLDWQQWIPNLPAHQELVWGAAVRESASDTEGLVPTLSFDPSSKSETLYSAFVQDEIVFADTVHLLFGSKFEVNEYTGLEVQPSVHAAWTALDERHTVWGGVSRSVRTPTRTDTDLSLTVPFTPGTPAFARILGSDDFQAEEVLAYEAGYRAVPRPWLNLDTTVFYNDYSNLLSLDAQAPFAESDPPPPHTVVPFLEQNLVEGRSYGFELATRFRPSERVRLELQYSLLHFGLTPEPESTDPTTDATERTAPRHQALLFTSLALPSSFHADAVLRYVSELSGQDVPAYTELDLQLEWHRQGRLRLALLGKNLLHDHHAEFGAPLHRVEVERSLIGRATWTW